MKYFTQTMTLMGTVRQLDTTQNSFEIECRSGDRFQIFVSTETVFSVLKNLDGLERDRVANPQGFDPQSPSHKLNKYIRPTDPTVATLSHLRHVSRCESSFGWIKRKIFMFGSVSR